MSNKVLLAAALAASALALAAAVPARAALGSGAAGGAADGPAGPMAPEIMLPAAACAGGLHPGEVVELRWRGAPPAADEMELLLSLDGGHRYTVRVTPDLDPDRGAYAWRVPPFASASARLALRADLSGRETILARSAPFRIVPAAAVPSVTTTATTTSSSGPATTTTSSGPAAALAAHRATHWALYARGGDLWVGDSLTDPGAAATTTADLAGQLRAPVPPPRLSPLGTVPASLTPPSPRPRPRPRPRTGRATQIALLTAAPSRGCLISAGERRAAAAHPLLAPPLRI